MSFLQHDMSPKDPNATYTPSQGQPARVKRSAPVYVAPDGSMIIRDPQTPKGQSSPPRSDNFRRKRDVSSQPIAKVGSSGFYSGEHSYAKKNAHRGGITGMHSDEATAMQERAAIRQAQRDFAAENQRQLELKRRNDAEHRKQSANLTASSINTDPWSKPDQVKVPINARKPRQKIDPEKVHGSENSYVSMMFGKSSVHRNDKGEVDAHRRAGVSRLRHHMEHGEDSYAARVFGKDGFGAPLKTQDGQVITKRPGRLENFAIYQEGDRPTYNDRVFGKPAVGGPPRRTSSGNVQCRRSKTLASESDGTDGDGWGIGKSKKPEHTKRVFLERRFATEASSNQHDLLDRKHQNVPPHPPPMTLDPEFSGRLMHREQKQQRVPLK